MNRKLLGLMFSIMSPMLIGTAQDTYAAGPLNNFQNGPVGAVVGVDAEYITPDTTELLIVGVQTNLAWIVPVVLTAAWIISVILAVIGIGIVIVRKL